MVFGSATTQALCRRALRPPAAVVGAVLLGICGACGAEAIDLTLVPDPNVNPRQQLVDRISLVRVILDAEGGLYSDQSERRIDDHVSIRDEDRDGYVELVADLDVVERGHLPTIRLTRDRLGDKPFDVRVRGLSRASSRTEIAAGGVAGVRFSPEDQALDVPFNLKPAFRPPRVTQTIPADGSSAEAVEVGSVFVVFSKRMDPNSIDEKKHSIRLLRLDGKKEVLVEPQELRIQSLRSDILPTTVEYRLSGGLDPGKYILRVSTEARDATAQGMRLDQVVMRSGNQPFSSAFSVTGAIPSSSCQGCPVAPVLFCHDGGDGCPGTMSCKDKQCRFSCPKRCPEATVCDRTLGLCVEDCRKNGSYGGCAADAGCGRDGLCRDR